MNNTEVISILKKLIATCGVGQEGFRNAAESTHNSEFRRLLSIFSHQRAQFVTELQAEVHRLGGEASMTADAAAPGGKRSNVVSILSRDEGKIMMECQREEEAAVNDYQGALKADLPLDVQYVVKRQYMDIKDAYDRIRILQRAA